MDFKHQLPSLMSILSQFRKGLSDQHRKLLHDAAQQLATTCFPQEQGGNATPAHFDEMPQAGCEGQCGTWQPAANLSDISSSSIPSSCSFGKWVLSSNSTAASPRWTPSIHAVIVSCVVADVQPCICFGL
jgi:hypothetical protein